MMRIPSASCANSRPKPPSDALNSTISSSGRRLQMKDSEGKKVFHMAEKALEQKESGVTEKRNKTRKG